MIFVWGKTYEYDSVSPGLNMCVVSASFSFCRSLGFVHLCRFTFDCLLKVIKICWTQHCISFCRLTDTGRCEFKIKKTCSFLNSHPRFGSRWSVICTSKNKPWTFCLNSTFGWVVLLFATKQRTSIENTGFWGQVFYFIQWKCTCTQNNKKLAQKSERHLFLIKCDCSFFSHLQLWARESKILCRIEKSIQNMFYWIDELYRNEEQIAHMQQVERAGFSFCKDLFRLSKGTWFGKRCITDTFCTCCIAVSCCANELPWQGTPTRASPWHFLHEMAIALPPDTPFRQNLSQPEGCHFMTHHHKTSSLYRERGSLPIVHHL